MSLLFNMPSRRRQWHPTPVFLPGKSHGRGSLEGCSPWGRWGLGLTELLHLHFSYSCIGEGNGNPLQCSCLENPRDGGAWWAAVSGVTESWTRLKWLSSSLAAAAVLSKLVLQWVSFLLMVAVTVCGDFGAQEDIVCRCFHCFPIYLLWSDGTRCHDLHFLNVKFLSQLFSLSLSPPSRDSSSSLLSAIRVVSSAYLLLLLLLSRFSHVQLSATP